MKQTNIKMLFVGLSLCSTYAFSNSPPLNCRNELDHNRNIYQGQAKCTAYYHYSTCPSGMGSCEVKQGEKILAQYIGETILPTAKLTGLANQVTTGIAGATLTETFAVNCIALVALSHTHPTYKEVCDHYPTVTLTIDNFSNREVYVGAGGHDKDGTVSIKLIIDGIVQSGTSKVLFGRIGDSFKVEAVVTDNDGYTSRKVDYATIKSIGNRDPYLK